MIGFFVFVSEGVSKDQEANGRYRNEKETHKFEEISLQLQSTPVAAG